MKQPKGDNFAELFIKEISTLAKKRGVTPRDLSRAEVVSMTSLSEWSLRANGGLAALVDLYFPNSGATSAYGVKMMNSHKKKLEKMYGTEEYIQGAFADSIREILAEVKVKVHPPTKRSQKAVKPAKKGRTIVAHLSDTHYGANIDEREIGGVNQFNWEIAARRTALFAEQIAMYKRQYRENTDLVLCINGDIIAGVIHDQEWFVDLLATQFAGSLNILTQMISYLAMHFNTVTVQCATGNHGRAMHKSSHQRASTHKWDSYESMLYVAIKEAMRAYKNVDVNIPITPYNIFSVRNHKFFLTHGDTVFNLGNPGSSINVKSINQQINRLNASELSGEESFAGIIMGHVHTPTVQITDTSCAMIINGCLSGLDPYAQSIGIFDSNPTQQLFEVTDNYAVGDIRFIQLKSADKRSELNKIIETFKGPL